MAQSVTHEAAVSGGTRQVLLTAGAAWLLYALNGAFLHLTFPHEFGDPKSWDGVLWPADGGSGGIVVSATAGLVAYVRCRWPGQSILAIAVAGLICAGTALLAVSSSSIGSRWLLCWLAGAAIVASTILYKPLSRAPKWLGVLLVGLGIGAGPASMVAAIIAFVLLTGVLNPWLWMLGAYGMALQIGPLFPILTVSSGVVALVAWVVRRIFLTATGRRAE